MSATFRDQVRDFLKANDPGRAPKVPAERLQWQRDWAALLVDEGFAAPAWPREWGGMDLSLADQVIYHEEFAKVQAPAAPWAGNLGSRADDHQARHRRSA